jgi:predicted transcriptional regulator of viral defense system
MDFERLLDLIGDEPVFETGLLLAGKVNPDTVRLQLTRWTKSRRVYQLRRGLYALAPPYQKVKPHPFLIANRMRPASYVSLQSALAYYGLIPEETRITLSVTTGRPGRWETQLGIFEYRHIQPAWLRGYRMIDLGNQQALVATPEKALLDLVYLLPGGDAVDYLGELRLQNLEQFDMNALRLQVEALAKPKLRRAAEIISRLARAEKEEYEQQ